MLRRVITCLHNTGPDSLHSSTPSITQHIWIDIETLLRAFHNSDVRGGPLDIRSRIILKLSSDVDSCNNCHNRDRARLSMACRPTSVPEKEKNNSRSPRVF